MGLTQLEERLIAPRLPYMMLRPLGWDRQLGLKGNIVNVPIDVNETQKVLPRKMSNSSVVHLALMRRMDYKLPYMFETIRPLKVYEACKYLVTTPLYIQEGITLSHEWKNRTEPIPFNENDAEDDCLSDAEIDMDVYAEDEIINDSQETAQSENSDLDNSIHKQHNQDVTRSEETMLISDTDLLSHAQKYAPGQTKRPISLLWDLNAEVLSFPTIYCGQKREVFKNLTYSDIAKSEARRYDRRACLPHKLLYSFKKSQIQQVVDSVTVSLRKKSNVQNVTAGNLLNNQFLFNMQQRNDGLLVLQNIRSSPAYWEARKKEVFATIRQLGMPTFFHTVSAMESHWPELLIILKQVLDHERITEEEATCMSQAEKSDLIRRDPITCARYFDSKTHDYFSLILKSRAVFCDHPLEDSFMRVEFQHRGSPHLHIFLWLKGAPKYDHDDSTPCIPFIDKYITTERSDLSLEFQQHRHTHCCRRLVNGAHICRFGIPYPPMLATEILMPLSSEYPAGKRIMAKQNLIRVKAELEKIRKDGFPEHTYSDFLKLLDLTETQYLEAIRSNIRRPTVFLKREVNAVFINAYNTKLLSAWRSNIDLQFILDPYACAKYLASYINKAYRGMSTLLRKTASELERGNLAIKAKLKTLGTLFVNKSEVSAQEAAYGILGLDLSRFSRDHTFINTGPIEKRVLMTKSRKALEALAENDTDVIVRGLIDHYSERSVELEGVCLADYAAWFNYKGGEAPAKCKQLTYNQKDGVGHVRKREFAKIIRYRRYGEKQDPYNFCREQVMLFHPWRNESLEVTFSPEVSYHQHFTSINSKFMEYDAFVRNGQNMEDMVENCEKGNHSGTLSEDEDPENQGVGPTDVNSFGIEHSEVTRDRFPLPGLIEESSYKELLTSLNIK